MAGRDVSYRREIVSHIAGDRDASVEWLARLVRTQDHTEEITLVRAGIDSYSFHRYFGEIRTGREEDPGKRWTVFDLIAFAQQIGAEGLSLETCYMPALDQGFLRELRSALDSAKLGRVLAWGHPVGLERGTSREALEDLKRHISSALALDSGTMRITASGAHYTPELEAQFARDLDPMLREAVRAAEDQGVILAIENHGDFNADALLRLLDRIGSPNLRVTLDAGNLLRVGDDPVEGSRKLAPYVAATHVKDLVLEPSSSPASPSYLCTPIGKGIVDFPSIVEHLRSAGYDGLLCVEIDGRSSEWAQTPEEELVRLSVDYLRSLIG
jgi:sugar phosphate isomerase/epimerase